MFVNWALRSVRDSLIQVDPLAAAIAYKGQRKAVPPSAIAHTPLLLQFTPFGTAALETIKIASKGKEPEEQCSVLCVGRQRFAPMVPNIASMMMQHQHHHPQHNLYLVQGTQQGDFCIGHAGRVESGQALFHPGAMLQSVSQHLMTEHNRSGETTEPRKISTLTASLPFLREALLTPTWTAALAAPATVIYLLGAFCLLRRGEGFKYVFRASFMDFEHVVWSYCDPEGTSEQRLASGLESLSRPFRTEIVGMDRTEE
ncbi:unnamed protein product [Toxocara canis]|uniref:Transmembrane protein n=1 Tax=Toxocara canis TaxID=6265 RepID=A0A183UGY3_TOXCA|nr:unnamed protein product [Toxocara canis]